MWRQTKLSHFHCIFSQIIYNLDIFNVLNCRFSFAHAKVSFGCLCHFADRARTFCRRFVHRSRLFSKRSRKPFQPFQPFICTCHSRAPISFQEERRIEQESCRRHFDTWRTLWGRPGHGAPIDHAQRNNLYNILHRSAIY